jgi:hypothetical protein
MNRWSSVITNVVATCFIWLTVIVVHVFAGSSSGMMDFVVIGAFGSILALWLVWGLSALGHQEQQTGAKAKRSAGKDDRLALLLELMSEDERQALKQRMLDSFQTDGEAISLAELIAAQERDSQQSRRS